jgi:hypothetical protein
MKKEMKVVLVHLIVMIVLIVNLPAGSHATATSIVLMDIDSGFQYDITDALRGITNIDRITSVTAIQYIRSRPADDWLLVAGDNSIHFLDAETFQPLFDLSESMIRDLFELPPGNGVFSALTLPGDLCDTILYFDPASRDWFGIDLDTASFGSYDKHDLTEPFYTGFRYHALHDTGLIIKNDDLNWWYETLPDHNRIDLDLASLFGNNPSHITEFSCHISSVTHHFLIAVIDSAGPGTPTPAPTATPTPSGSANYDVVIAMGLDETLWRINSQNYTAQPDAADTGLAPNRIIEHAGELFVVNSLSHSITVYDPLTLSLKRELSVGIGTNPFDMVFVDDRSFYVTQFNSNTVSRIDAYSGQVTAVIDMPEDLPADPGKTTFPRPSGITRLSDTAYVACPNLDTSFFPGGPGILVTIDIHTDQVTGWFESGGRNCVGIAGNSHFPEWLWVINAGDYSSQQGFNENGTIAVYDAGSVEPFQIIDTFDAPVELVFGTDRAYFASAASGRIGRFEMDTFSILPSIYLSSGGQELNMVSGLAVAPDYRLWALEFNHNKLWVIDTTQDDAILHQMTVGRGPDALIIIEKSRKRFEHDPFVGRVVEFNQGDGGGYGMDRFPDIVLGPPRGAGATGGSTDVLSLGDGGSITLEFVDTIALNGPGPDLIIFENPFYTSGDTENVYAEVAFVEVSQDGQTFIRFPNRYDPEGTPVNNPLNWSGFAGVEPVYSHPDNGIDPTDPEQAGGDLFDLDDVGLDWIRYVRIIDTDEGENAAFCDHGNRIYDPGLPGGFTAGFDLDAVAAIFPQAAHTPTPTPSPTPFPEPTPTPTPSAGTDYNFTLYLSSEYFTAGDPFLLETEFSNYSDNLQNVFLYIILDVSSEYFFYPSWGSQPDAEIFNFHSGTTSKVILDFSWPDVTHHAEKIVFWGGILSGEGMILGDIDHVFFSF